MRTGPHVSLTREVLHSEESPRASGLLYPTEVCWTFWREQRAVAVEQSLVLSN